MAHTPPLSADFLEQQLPYNLEAEQSVLGAILVDSGCISDVLEEVNAQCFFREENAQIFSIMVELFTASRPIDHITVLDRVLEEKVFERDADARVYITQLIQVVPSTKNVGEYAKIVREKHYVRSLIFAARDIIDNSQDPTYNAQQLVDSAEQKIYDIRSGRESATLERIDRIIIDIYDRLQRLSGEDRDQYVGIPTGFTALDRTLTGLNRTDLILVAGRPGMGKSSFAFNIASNVALKHDATVAIFTLEMSREQLVERMLSSDALVESNKLRTGELSTDDWVRLADSAAKLSQAQIFVDDSADITVPEMKARLRRLRGLDLVIIDYLQLMSSTHPTANRVQEVSEITRGLKIMAGELRVPVILASQLSRGPEARPDKRPLLSDLRDSGAIEQDADSVLFLYRDAYYDRESEEQNVAECIVAKNRHGETGTIKLAWDGPHTRFTNLEIYRDDY